MALLATRENERAKERIVVATLTGKLVLHADEVDWIEADDITQRFMLVRAGTLFASRLLHWSNVWIANDSCARIARPSLTWIALTKSVRKAERQSSFSGVGCAYLLAGGGARA